MRKSSLVVAFLAAGCATQEERRPSAVEHTASVRPVEFRSAFEGYRSFADQELQDWRKANEEVGAAGGHAGNRPGQGPGQRTSKPEPGKPDSAGGHEGHK